MRRWSCFSVLVLLAAPALAQTPADNLGGPGESCRARSDCKPGLKCLDNKCLDEHEGLSCTSTPECGTELKCINNVCVNPNARFLPQQPQPQPQPRPPPVFPPPDLSGKPEPKPEPMPERRNPLWDRWLRFEMTGTHVFGGLSFGVGALTGGYSGKRNAWGSGADSAFDVALRGGVVIDERHELAVELSPFTYLWDTVGAGEARGPGDTRGAAFKIEGTYAFLIPLLRSTHLYYPLRAGIGTFFGGINTSDHVLFELRADPLGLAWRTGHVIVDLHLPSIRYAFTNARFDGFGGSGVTQHLVTFMFGMSASYVF